MHRPRLFVSALTLLLAVLPGRAADTSATPPLEAFMAVGASLVRDNRLAHLGWSDSQIEAFLRGVRAGFRGENVPVDAAAQDLFNEIGRRMQQLEAAEKQRQFSAEAFAQPGRLAAYLKEMRKQFSLEVSDSGLGYVIKSPGYGAKPGPEDTIIVSYKVSQADAQTDLPQLTVDRLKIKVADLLPGLAEAFQMMSAGSIALLVVPPDLSYGAGRWPPGTEPGTPLVFTLKLHEIVNPP